MTKQAKAKTQSTKAPKVQEKRGKDKIENVDKETSAVGLPDIDFKKVLGCGG